MNERIRLLAEQAEILITEVGAFHNTPQGAYQLKEQHMKKFAQLIVRECIEIVEYKGRKVGTKHPVGFNLMDAAWDIKEHFGVEE